MTENSRLPVTVDVVSDVVCPWCYLGQKRLDAAIASVPGLDVTVNWRPYQLDPTIPQGGVDREAYMRKKFGDGDRLRQAHERLVQLGAADGIAFDFGAIQVAPNTLDPHRVIRWAGSAGSETQGKLVKSLFSGYFEHGADIGDPVVLVDAARQAGMDAAVVEALLPTDTDRDTVRAEAETASRMGITGVPCFLLEGRYAVMGAQETATLAEALREVAALRAAGKIDRDA